MPRATPSAGRLLPAAAALAVMACASEPPTVAPIDHLPRPLTEGERRVIAGGNDFAFTLLREVDAGHRGRNVLLSPLSASMALGMTMNGARSATFDGMRSALGLDGLEQSEINASYRDLIVLLRELDPRVQMRIANSIWYRHDLPVESDFLDVTSRFFDAPAGALDFSSPDAVATINDWAARATAGRIPAILDEIAPNEVMFLVNAIWFKGLWQTRFDPAHTRDAVFHREDAGPVTVPLMSRRGAVATVHDRSATMVDLPYGGGAYSMTLLLPNGDATVESVIREMTRERWDALLASLQPSELVLELPRVRLEWGTRLTDPLIALGMADAFDPQRADFSGISGVVGGAGGLYITRVDQKAFIAVDEAGTEAAAATIVGMGRVSLPPAVRFDRPFLFAIRERLSGTILFVGKIADPSRTD